MLGRMLESGDPHCTYALSCVLMSRLAHCTLGLQRKMHSEAEAQIRKCKTAHTHSLAPKACITRINPRWRSLELSRAPPIWTQNTSQISLCSTSSGLCQATWGRHSPARYSSLQLVLLLAWEACLSVHAKPCLSCHPRLLQRTPPTMLLSPRSKKGASSLLTTREHRGVLPTQPPYPITAKRNLS